ncbi:ribonuclease H1-like [Tamandua tetradactyla]|uniref:ribonuclease H1-like n=1 Tax=Tamandua tetradactyla TaxID=48850 RepID=UPI0040547163
MSSWRQRGQASGWGSDQIDVYIDGSCKNNGRDGAEAGIGVHWGRGHPLNACERVSGRQTNQTAELQAAYKAIKQARSQNMNELTIGTDSQFVIKGMTEWIGNWKDNGWKTASGRDVVNKAEFQKIDQASQGMDIKWVRNPYLLLL